MAHLLRVVAARRAKRCVANKHAEAGLEARNLSLGLV